jgi:phosphoglycolate phosphatase-like HAD superfamily hydrolase
MPRVQYNIFDLDGVFDDRMPVYTESFATTFEELGVGKDVSVPFYLGTAGTPVRKQIQQLLAQSKVRADVLKCEKRFWELVGNQEPRPFPGGVELVRTLKEQGRNLYITTGSQTEEAKERLAKMGILDYIDIVQGSDGRMQKGRAHLEVFKNHSRNQAFRFETSYLGDGPSDMKYAKEFGIEWPIGITTTVKASKLVEAGARKVIASLNEFVPLIAKLENTNL